ncbi:hypothetical protein IWW55_005755 [Coemansia sp. RSA 2706]|nr:hypothetical protein IWW55_005755 [Coemansia sp. RSA 2706]KAJ2329129.1 hypothetical protein IWW51_000787 [Coemansia sp. RSA 2702]
MLADNLASHDAVNLKCASDKHTEHLHLLPCSVHHDGPAKTATYFVPDSNGTTSTAAFRGRQLQGLAVALPPGYIGHVVVESSASTDNAAFEHAADTRLELLSTELFSKFTVWEHDRLPRPADDQAISALAWVDVAASIHQQ